MNTVSRFLIRIVGPLCILFLVHLTQTTVHAMDFTVRAYNILMQGEIRKGDYERFRTFMLANFKTYVSQDRTLYLNSDGGDLAETLKIAGLIRTMYASVGIEYTEGKGECASSCFFLYLSGTERSFGYFSRLGIHRAYFDPAYFSGLSLKDAKVRQDELTSAVGTILKDNSVPQSLIDRMNSTSSTEIYWLEYPEMEALGDRPAWYEEFLTAKCGYNKGLMNRLATDDQGRWLSIYYNVKDCEERFVNPELAKVLVGLQPIQSPEKKGPGDQRH